MSAGRHHRDDRHHGARCARSCGSPDWREDQAQQQPATALPLDEAKRAYDWDYAYVRSHATAPLLGPAHADVATAAGRRAARTDAQQYARAVWLRHVAALQSRFTAVPMVFMRFGRDARDGAEANRHLHRILIDYDACRPSVVLHELAHLLVVERGHNPQFCRALVRLWQYELNIDPSGAIASAKLFGVAIAPVTRSR